MAGSFGYELDLNLLTEEEKEQIRAQLVYAGVPVPRLGNEYKSWQVYVKEV